MKTKELIRLLQEEDPSGEIECCIGNADIKCVYLETAYWDGCLQVFKRNESGKVIGAKYISEGMKLQIDSMSIEDAIYSIPDLEVEYTSEYVEKYRDNIDKIRQKAIDIKNKVHRESFVAYFIKKYGEKYKELAEKFSLNLTYKDKMSDDIREKKIVKIIDSKEYIVTPSWNERWCEQWDREIYVLDGEIAWSNKQT